MLPSLKLILIYIYEFNGFLIGNYDIYDNNLNF